MTGGTTFAKALTTMFDDSQTGEQHVHLACGLLISSRCVLESLEVSTH